MDESGWRNLARRRIISVLRLRRVSSLRQLEIKISEAGPNTIRPEPHHVKAALDGLIAEDIVHHVADVTLRKNTPTPIYAHPSFDPNNESDALRLRFILQTYETYLGLALSPKGGRPLELVVQASIEAAAPAIHWFGEADRIPSGTFINGRAFTGHGNLDHLLLDPQSSLFVGVEDKNHREWIYPRSAYLRSFLAKCVHYDIVPLFITRRLPYISRRRVLPRLGILGFQTYYQFFLPSDADLLADARHTDGLGFHDLRFTSDPLPTLVNYLTNTLPRHLPAIHDTFQANKDELRAYAVDRTIEYDDLTRELEVFYPNSEDTEDMPPEDYDGYGYG